VATDRDGALARFLSSAGLVDDAEVKKKLDDFQRTLGRRAART
jgi:hypothetical protein